MLDVDELKLLLTLNGNVRIPHLEDEIFVDCTLTALYLQHLTFYRMLLRHRDVELLTIEDLDQQVLNPGEGWTDTEIQAWAVYFYVDEVLDQRWEVAEYILQKADMSRYHGWSYLKRYNIRFGVDLACSL